MHSVRISLDQGKLLVQINYMLNLCALGLITVVTNDCYLVPVLSDANTSKSQEITTCACPLIAHNAKGQTQSTDKQIIKSIEFANHVEDLTIGALLEGLDFSMTCSCEVFIYRRRLSRHHVLCTTWSLQACRTVCEYLIVLEREERHIINRKELRERPLKISKRVTLQPCRHVSTKANP